MSPRSALSLLLALGLVTGCGTGASEPVQGRWWNWAYSGDERTSPVRDTSGRFCARDQPRDVWFLAGTFGGTARRTCAVPQERPIVFPLVNLVAPVVQCRAFMTAAKGGAVLDGQPVTSEHLEDDVVVNRRRSHACGLWVRLHPLSPGTHTLTLQGSSGDFHTNVTYTLVVTPASRA
ncbi:signal protein [Streptosporangium saharense]|uniref:signal protein n=1 Tax=Streptosporangium saharense TaxID=1706840 RepID=UPI0034401D2B